MTDPANDLLLVGLYVGNYTGDSISKLIVL